MKRIINTTSILAATLITAGAINAAEGFNPRTRALIHEQKAQNGSLKTAVNTMVASIERSLGIFEGLNRSQREKMAEFKNILSQIDYCIKVTATDGALSKKISGAVSLAHQQVEWCTKTAETKADANLANRYRALGQRAAEKATAIQKNAQLVISVNRELAEIYPIIEEEKDFYYAAAVVGDLENGNKSLVEVQKNMKRVVGLLKQLGGLSNQFNVPATVIAQR